MRTAGSRGRSVGEPRVVTIGGGHGQSAVLAALRRLDCQVTAVVSVADDGGCSGRLREQFGMPPPGDLRRCLTTLARDRTLAERFEARLQHDSDEALRSAGNLVLLEAYLRLGSLQAAIDWAAQLLACRGRVLPVAEVPGRLAIYDRHAGIVEGESNIARTSAEPMVAVVRGPEASNPRALEAIESADLVLIGPGSFITSTLAALTTAEVAASLSATRAARVLLHNVASEPGQTQRFELADFVRLLRDHVLIHGGEDTLELTVLRHEEAPGGSSRLPDGTRVLGARLADESRPRMHDPERLAEALAAHCGLRTRTPESSRVSDARGVSTFERYLQQATRRLSGQGSLAAARRRPR